MTKNIGMWIDHKRAVIVILTEKGMTMEHIDSEAGGRVHYRGLTRPKTPYSAQYQKGDDQLDRQFIGRLNKFYGTVISRLRDADALLIFGPGEAKSELEKRLAHEKIRVNITNVETADKMTDRQIVAKVELYFK
jgi:hypothetical protein